MITPGTGPALVWCPFPDRESAAAAAKTLLDRGLIACANMLPEMRSLYVWNGEAGDAEEVGVLFKTNVAALDALLPQLEQLHPYEEPAILAWRCDDAWPGTAAWLAALGR